MNATIIPSVEGNDWWLRRVVAISILDRNAFFHFSAEPLPSPDPMLPRAEPLESGPGPVSDNFIIREYGLRIEAIPFARNYFVAALDQHGARTLCDHNHRSEPCALACAEKSLKRQIKKLRIDFCRKKNIPLKHIPKQRKKYKPL